MSPAAADFNVASPAPRGNQPLSSSAIDDLKTALGNNTIKATSTTALQIVSQDGKNKCDVTLGTTAGATNTVVCAAVTP